MTPICVVPAKTNTTATLNYGNAPLGPDEVAAFAADAAEWFTAPASPTKTATYYDLVHRARQLRSQTPR